MNSLVQTLGIQGPLIIAPMGAGPTTPELVAATSNAGALGSFAAAYLQPEEIEKSIAKVRTLTEKPFAVNLFAPMPPVEITESQLRDALEVTRPFRDELSIDDPKLPTVFHSNFDNEFAAVMKTKPRAFSFTFGLIKPEHIKECRKNQIFVIGTATTLDEAQALAEIGVDAVVCQGTEAGAHRGIFSPTAPEPGVGVFDLVRQCSTKVKIPVIAAGGLMTGGDIAAALKTGAQAAVLGTAFLLCPEAGTAQPYREALRAAAPGAFSDYGRAAGTKLTRAFSGRLARGLENTFMREIDAQPSKILAFPAQNVLTRDIRRQSSLKGRSDMFSLWAGTGVDKIRELPAAELVRTIFEELHAANH
jgi:nitronate monooxygenase